MSDNGYIRLHRSLLQWEWYSSPETLTIFIHCLLKANWRDGKFQGYEVKRGSFVTSRAKLAQETGLTERGVRTALNHLISTGEVTKSSYSKFSIITVQNYEKYQKGDQQSDQQVTSKRPASDHNRRKKESKKGRNIGVSKDTLSSNDDAVASVIDHLNEKTGSHYKQTQGTEKYIRARLNEGFTVEELNAVTDKKTEEWLSSEKMAKYLRPSTLFNADKFQGYLEECQEHDDGLDWSDISTYFDNANNTTNLRVVHDL